MVQRAITHLIDLLLTEGRWEFGSLGSKIRAHNQHKYLGEDGEEHQNKEQICHPDGERGAGIGDLARSSTSAIRAANACLHAPTPVRDASYSAADAILLRR